MVMDLDTLTEGTFHVWQPNSVDLLKGSPDAEWRIGGYASTEARDRQGEVVLAKGLDFSEFVQFGYYNDNHQQHTAAAVGVPEKAEYHKGKGWWTEGYLLKGVERARQIFDLAKSLEGTPRRLGFSIEGKIIERFGEKIVKAIIRNVALTNSPVNCDCLWTILTKAWATDLEMKALSVGHARSPESGGRVLVPSDLERDEIKYIYRCPKCSKAFGSTVGLEGHVEKSHQSSPITADQYPSIIRQARSLDKSEAVNFIHKIRPDYSEEVCSKLVDFVLNHSN